MRMTLAALLAAVALPAAADPEAFEIDASHTTIAFLVEHIGYSNTLGLFTEVEGGFTYDADTQTVTDVRIVVPAGSFWSNDDARDNHVLSGDFLDASNHPEIVFTASEGVVTGEGQGEVQGELTLLGQTHPLTLAVTLNKAETYPFGHQKMTLGISARGELMRSTWGMDYGVANGLVGDRVELIIETEALAAE